MSGICGIVKLDNFPTTIEMLESMATATDYLGPDGIAYWIQENIGMAHLALHTTPESLFEKQPLADLRSKRVLVADVRLDNRQELIQQLRNNHFLQAYTPTDADLILAAYDHWGEHSPKHLVGDFAYAIWDAKEQRLFCAVDHLGVKPFYYYYQPYRLFAFGSTIKNLITLPIVPKIINEERIYHHITKLKHWDQTTTFYQQIYSLRAAHYLMIDQKGLHLENYWSFDTTKEIYYATDDDYTEAFKELFVEVVQNRLRNSHAIGFLLSGGLDSSSITAVSNKLISQKENDKIHTYSLVFDDVPASDETYYINQVLQDGGFEPHFIRGDQISPLSKLESMMDCLSEAISAPNLFLHWGVFEEAKNTRRRILLDGFGGDQVVYHGLDRLTYLSKRGKYLTLIREAYLASRLRSQPAWFHLWMYGISPLIPQFIRNIRHSLRRSFKINPEDQLIKNSFVLNYQPRHSERQKPSNLRELHRFNIQYHGQSTLKTFMNSSAIFGVEMRFPFYDKRIVEYCLALPEEQHFSNGFSRPIQRRAMQNELPPNIQWRVSKGNLSHNFIYQLMSTDKDELKRIIIDDADRLSPYYNIKTLQNLYSQNIKFPNQSMTISLWIAASLSKWLKFVSK